jgi:S-formylglutathione hydrolase FrmB
MRTLAVPAAPGAPADLAIALLPGTYSQPEDFVRERFPEAARAQGVDCEIVMAEMRAAWFADGSIVQRMHEHVVLPARARGRSRIWLGGVSLGALAALCYAARHACAIEGLALISPYPATREVLREIEAAGGLGRWRPVVPREGDLEREAWRWLAAPRPGGPRVHCCFASGDRFVQGQRLMAQALDARCVRELPGGHDWDAWRRLWSEFLADARAALR